MRTLLPMVLLIMTATVAHADHKLLITDVLSAGDVEVSATFGYYRTEFDVTTDIQVVIGDRNGISQSMNLAGKFTNDTVGSDYAVGIGLGKGIQLNLGVPYYFVDESTYRYDMIPYRTDRDRTNGFGDMVLGMKYLLYEDVAQPVVVVTGLNVKPRTASSDREGTGTTDIAPYVAISFRTGELTRPYASYKAVIRDHGAADSHVLSAGVEYPVSKTITVKPEIEVAFMTASNRLRSYESYGVGMESYVQLYEDLYLIPFVSAALNTSTTAKVGSYAFGTAKSVSAGIGLYYYWN